MKNRITLGSTWPGTIPTTKNEADIQFFTVMGFGAAGLYTAYFFAKHYDTGRDFDTLRRHPSPQKDYTFIPSVGRDGKQRRDTRGELLFKTVPGFEEVTRYGRDKYLEKREKIQEEEANRIRQERADAGGYR